MKDSEPLAREIPYLAIALGVVGLDRATKFLVETRLDPFHPVTVIPGLFDLTHVRNPGGVFGVFKNLDPGLRSVIFTAVPVVAVILIAFYARRVPAAQRWTRAALALILGGAAGNLIDRIRAGYVTDFLDFYWRDHHWPAFNAADSAICVGVGILILESVLMADSAAGPAGSAAAHEDKGGGTP